MDSQVVPKTNREDGTSRQTPVDGVIKYAHEFLATEALAASEVDALVAVRSRLVELGLVGSQGGIGFGNLSHRHGDGFVITGTQTGHVLNADGRHFARVEAWDVDRFFLRSSGPVHASSEAITHGTLYGIHPSIGAVIHVHSRALWRFMLGGTYARTKDVPYGTPEMTREVVRLVSPMDPFRNPVFAMAGHEDGVIAYGASLPAAEHALLEVLGQLLESS